MVDPHKLFSVVDRSAVLSTIADRRGDQASGADVPANTR